ncbi:unnamed protein product, partial [Ectocarpus sp. 12 AP-2014]
DCRPPDPPPGPMLVVLLLSLPSIRRRLPALTLGRSTTETTAATGAADATAADARTAFLLMSLPLLPLLFLERAMMGKTVANAACHRHPAAVWNADRRRGPTVCGTAVPVPPARHAMRQQ